MKIKFFDVSKVPEGERYSGADNMWRCFVKTEKIEGLVDVDNYLSLYPIEDMPSLSGKDTRYLNSILREVCTTDVIARVRERLEKEKGSRVEISMKGKVKFE